MTRLVEPTITLVIEWVPVGPETWEGYYRDTILRVEFDSIINRWRWSCFDPSETTSYGYRGDRTAGMMSALAWAGCESARIAEGVA